MKNLLLTGLVVISTSGLFAQQEVPNQTSTSVTGKCVKFRETEPLWKLAQESGPVERFATPKVVNDMEEGEGRREERMHQANTNPQPDGALQSVAGTNATNGTIESFDGVAGQGYVPLDANGMVGSNYYVQTINSVYAVWNKNGTAKLAQTDFKKLFGSFTADDGDPVTMYDKFADRWIITEFQSGKSSSTIDTMMFAVSETNDPTGKYYIYAFCYNSTETSDYPKFSIWADGYYQTCNCSPTDYVVVYNRDSMLKGSKNANYIAITYTYSPFASNCGGEFYCPQTLYADGTLPPYGSPNYMFDFQDPNWGSSCATTNAIRIFSISVNWKTKTGTIALAQTLTTASFDSYFTANANNNTYRHDIDQPGSTASLDASDGFFSYRIPYLRWGSYNSALMCNVVVTGTNATTGSQIGGVRWYELRQDTTTKQWSIYQQSTYAPSDNITRWCPAIAMDQNGSIGLQYSVSDNKSTYPGLRYTGRTSCDPLNTMTLAEGIAATGNIAANTSYRWGDYSHLSVDPTDGITFWGTSMYANKSISGSYVTSHIYSFQIPQCVTTGINTPAAIDAQLSAYQSGSMLNVIATKLPQCNNIYIELFDLNGKKLMGTNAMPSGDELRTSLNVSSLAKGIYFVRIINDSFQRVVKVPIN